jgi:hypothetical protein
MRACQTRSAPKRRTSPASCQSSRAARASCGVNRPSCWPAAGAARSSSRHSRLTGAAGRLARAGRAAAARAARPRPTARARLLEAQLIGYAIEFEFQHRQPGARAASGQLGTQRAAQPAQHEAQWLQFVDRWLELGLGTQPLDRHPRPQRPAVEAARQVVQQPARLAETGHHRRARDRREFADPAQPEDAQPLADRLIGRQQADRQRRQVGRLGSRATGFDPLQPTTA